MHKQILDYQLKSKNKQVKITLSHLERHRNEHNGNTEYNTRGCYNSS